jgi:hypothetical protein
MSSAEETEHNEPSLSSKRSRQDDIQPGQDVFSVTLEHALSRQKDLFLQEIEFRFGNVNTKKPGEGKFDFKNEGLKRQFLFNNDRLEAFDRIEILCSSNRVNTDAILSIVITEAETINKRNKLLKIADRHGWDTVHEYSDDPLADDEEDAVKLWGAISRANRARKSKPYDVSQRKVISPLQSRSAQSFQGLFRNQSIFRGYSEMNKVSKMVTEEALRGKEYPMHLALHATCPGIMPESACMCRGTPSADDSCQALPGQQTLCREMTQTSEKVEYSFN